MIDGKKNWRDRLLRQDLEGGEKPGEIRQDREPRVDSLLALACVARSAEIPTDIGAALASWPESKSNSTRGTGYFNRLLRPYSAVALNNSMSVLKPSESTLFGAVKNSLFPTAVRLSMA